MSLQDKINIPSSVEETMIQKKLGKRKQKRLKQNNDFILLNIDGYVFLFILQYC